MVFPELGENEAQTCLGETLLSVRSWSSDFRNYPEGNEAQGTGDLKASISMVMCIHIVFTGIILERTHGEDDVGFKRGRGVIVWWGRSCRV